MDRGLTLHLLTLIYCAKAYIPVGYLGCYDDSKGQHLSIVLKSSSSNSGDECKARCSSDGYRYAGTKAANQCHCSTVIKNNQTSARCNFECRGRVDEKCGGLTQISIYDTWQCATKPCGDKARSCFDVSATTYICRCEDRWTGKNCSEESLPIPTSVFKTTTTSIPAGNESTQMKTTMKPRPTILVSVSTTTSLSYSSKPPTTSKTQEESLPIPTSVLRTTTTSIPGNESTQMKTTMKPRPTIWISVLTTTSLSNSSRAPTTSQNQKDVNAENQDSMHIWFILAAVAIVFFLVVAIVAFFLGRRKGRRAMLTPVPNREPGPQTSVYNELDIIQRSSNQYATLDEIQHTTANGNGISNEDEGYYLTPCTFKPVDTSSDYAYIDEETELKS